MVELRPEPVAPGPVVTGFTPTGFKVGSQRLDSGLILTAQSALSWQPPSYQDLKFSDIMAALSEADRDVSAIEFLLLGSGPVMAQPSAAFRQDVARAGIGLEVMDSRAAARTWGILRAEERQIIGAFMPLA